MNIKSFSKLAAVSAIALTASLYASGIMAQTTITIGDDIDISVVAEVLNTIDVDVTDINFGTIGAMGNTLDPLDVAQLRLSPDGTEVDGRGTGYGTATQASMVFDPDDDSGARAPGEVAITNAFANTQMFVTIAQDTCTDLVDGNANVIHLASILLDDGVAVQELECDPLVTFGTYTGIPFTTGPAGEFDLALGAIIETTDEIPTSPNDGAYPSGTYTGEFTMYISY